MKLRATCRDTGEVIVIDFSGQITLGEGSALLRKLIAERKAAGAKRIVLNLADVDYIDSSGIGELVNGFISVRNSGGELKLLNLGKRVHDVLLITKLYTIFDVHTDEETAIRSFR